jgi:hypothetical protein
MRSANSKTEFPVLHIRCPHCLTDDVEIQVEVEVTFDSDEEGNFLTFDYEVPPLLKGREKDIEEAARECLDDNSYR